MPQDFVVPITIAANGTLSAAVDLTAYTIVTGLVMPTAWTPAAVTVQVSPDGINFYDMYDGVPANLMTFNVHSSSIVAISPDRLRCCAAIKLRSGTPQTPVVQTAARQFGIVASKSTL